MAWRVIDANLAVALVVRYDYSAQAEKRIKEWQAQKDDFYVPSLWQYEVVSSLRRAVVGKLIKATELNDALASVFSLRVQVVEPTLETHRVALAWAERLIQGSAYDAQYLTLAEQLGAEFWSADSRLVNRAHQLKLHWVHHIAE